METTPGIHDLGHAEAELADSLTAMLSFFVAVAGITSAFMIYGSGQPSRAHQSFMKAIQPLSRFASRKFLVDEFYLKVVVIPVKVFSKILMLLEVLLFEPLMQGIAALPRVFGRAALARHQNGLVQSYAAASTLAVVLLLVVLLFLR